MTSPDHSGPSPRETKRRHRSPHGPGLWITDAELIELLGVPADIARAQIAQLDSKGYRSFPPKVKEWGDRRYRPAVEAWFERNYGPRMGASLNPVRRAS